MNQIKIESQVFLKDDLHNILRALAVSAPAGEYGEGFRAALVAVATATGMEQAAGSSPSTPVDASNLQVGDRRRYKLDGSVGDYGEQGATDLRRNVRGVMLDGIGFVEGGYVRPDGRVEFEHPWQNPYRGMR